VVGVWRSGGRRRLAYAAALAALMVVGMLFYTLDSRVLNLQGDYNSELIRQTADLGDALRRGWSEVMNRDLTMAFFSQTMTPGWMWSILVVAGMIWACVRLPHWVVPALLLLAVTMLVSSSPRYFLIMLPLLWVGWVWMSAWVTVRTPGWIQGYVFAALMLMPLSMNLGKVGRLTVEQRSADVAWWQGTDRQARFLSRYDDGEMVPVLQMADVIRRRTTPDQTVIAPHANVLAYLSGRRVVGERSVIPGGTPRSKHFDAVRSFDADFWVLPAIQYRSRDQGLFNLLQEKRVIPSRAIEWSDPYYLAEVTYLDPTADEQPTQPPGETPSTTSASVPNVLPKPTPRSPVFGPATSESTARIAPVGETNSAGPTSSPAPRRRQGNPKSRPATQPATTQPPATADHGG
jgi:hypothetical protein